MKPEKTQRLFELLGEMLPALTTIVFYAEDLRTLLRGELDGREPPAGSHTRRSQADEHVARRPFVDHQALCVRWNGKKCSLGNTIVFRLFDRLAKRMNQYVTYSQLREDVWEGHTRSRETVRSVVRHLKQRLVDAGMHDLGASIRGHGQQYGLMLDT